MSPRPLGSALLLLLLLILPQAPFSQTGADLHLYPFVEVGIRSLIETLWDPAVGAFKDSPDASHLWWADDQGKILAILAEYADRYDWGYYADAAAGFIDALEYDGLVIRRRVEIKPVIVQDDPMNFAAHNNWLYEVRGNLSRSDYQRFTISYKQSNFNITCIQGQSVRYNQSGLATELVRNPSAENGSAAPDYWYGGGNTGGYRYGPELVSNPDVETPAPYNWYTGGGAWSTAESRSPSHSLLLNLSAASGDWRSHHFPVAGGGEYRVEGWFKGAVTGGEWFLTIRWFSGGDGTGFISEENIPLTGYSDWTLVSSVFTAPSNALSADLLFRAINGSGELYGDDFSVRRRTLTQGYVWSSAEARTGNRSLLIDVYQASADWRSRHFHAVPDREYNVTAWVKGTVTGDEYFITLRWFSDEAASQFISEQNIPIPQGTYSSWTLFTANATSPSNALSADLLFRAINADGTVYVDDLSVKKYEDDLIEYSFETAITDWMVVDRQPEAVDLIQIVEDEAIRVVFNYTLARAKPYLLLNVTVNSIGSYPLREVWIHNAFDQLDFYGTPLYAGAYPLGYRYVYFPGYGEVAADNTEPQHLLTWWVKNAWNRNYFVIHMRDIPDIFDRSLAIAVILGNKTLLDALDNVEVIQPYKLHWLKMYYALGDIDVGASKTYTMKYVFLNAHDWSNMAAYDPFFSNIDSYENLDLSLTHQYGSILYGLAKLYYHTGNPKYYTLAERIWSYYYNMFTRTGNGTYLQSFPFAIKAAILLWQKTNNVTYYNAAVTLGSHLLSRQQLNPLARNYGGFREWGGAEYVYLDFEAPAGGVLRDLYMLTGDERYRTAHQAFVQSLFIDPEGFIACYRDPDGIQVDTDLPSYKAALFLVASTMGWNDTLTLRAISHVWQRASYTPDRLWINVTYRGLPWGQEPSSESMGWGLAAWLAYARYMASVCNGVYMEYLSDDSPSIEKRAFLREARFESPMRFTAVISGPRSVNATARIYIPLGTFANDQFFVEVLGSPFYGYNWNSSSRILTFWVVLQSDATIVVKAPEPPGGAPPISLIVGAIDLGSLSPGTTKPFNITVEYAAYQVTFTAVEFGDRADWFRVQELPATFTRGLNPTGVAQIAAQLKVPENAAPGEYTISLKLYWTSPEGGTAQAGSSITFKVYTTGAIPPIDTSQILETATETARAVAERLLGDPTLMLLLILTTIVLSSYILRERQHKRKPKQRNKKNIIISTV